MFTMITLLKTCCIYTELTDMAENQILLRAAVRGRCIEKFGSQVQATQWDYILLKGAQKKIELDLRNLFDAGLVRQSLKIISAAQTVEDLAQLKSAKIV